MYLSVGCEGRTGLLNKVTIPELEFPASTVGYPKDIVRDPVVTIHGPAKGTAWFPTVRHQGNIVMQNIITDLALRTRNIVTDPTYLHKPFRKTM